MFFMPNKDRLFKSGNRRTKLVKINILLGIVVKGLSILASLMLVPMTINYISSELYGIWLTLSSIILWIGFFDIGFGNGLRNKLGESIALGKYRKGQIYVSTTYAVLFFVFVSIGALFYFLSPVISWSSFLNVSQQYNETLIIVAQILFLAFSVQMVLKLIQNVIQAFQFNALASLLDALGNIIALGFIYLLTITMAPDLTIIAMAYGMAPVIVLAMASIILYSTKFRKICPRIGYIRMKFAKEIFNLGGEFFIIQIAALVLYQMINIIISRICGPIEVTNYNIVYKYLSIVMMGSSIIIVPIWSAFTDAYTKNDYTWMMYIYRKLINIFYLSVIVSTLMIIISPVVYHVWIGDDIHIDILTSILVGIYMIIGVWGQIHSTILNGMGKIRFQVIYSLIIMIVFIPLAIGLGNLIKLPGILLAMIIVNAPGSFLGRYQVLGLINKTASGIWTK